MKPHRLSLTHNLVMSYGLDKHMQVYRPHRATEEELMLFHTEDYVDFIKRVSPDNISAFSNELRRFNVGEERDCPVFEGLLEYCQIYSGGSIDGAMQLINNQCDVAVNWAGGLHHARSDEASGFCYINDIVLAIVEMLRYYARVLYVDIDIHHGDGVQDAFYMTNRVLTVSFHKYGDGFFPGTGDVSEVGVGNGKYHAINVPLRDGIDDEGYLALFRPIIRATIEKYRPQAVVLQCGADSLNCDRLGRFNLSLRGHAECVRFVKGFGLPTLVLGGGGYTIRNVARCWTNETASILDKDISNNLPVNDYYGYFAPFYQLHPTVSHAIQNTNSKQYIEIVYERAMEVLRGLECAPSVEMFEIPPDLLMRDIDRDEQRHPDSR
eukprot:CAMPEP_0206198044 /NCGR_PEP_ID=MMETSP0166-20121206/9403_1 /ASSEMBLY_ACC=CAM_ASM_000260 /TAXON_ID=95228 /ORGANISM="Vannella robusta, Strain DIVA3 518/3/11/1/6" /LENGTH=379 /DNA_ID=CAMNT_0053615823 /DNA_START=1 /DNA_END=1137 /DNA_ORIENTATION=+